VLASWVYNDSWHQGRLRSDDPDGETRRELIDADSQVGISMSVTLTIGLAAAGEGPIGIVTCAKGGTSAHEWRTDGPLFGACIARVREALPGNRLKGLVWYQGEADAYLGLADMVRFYQRTLDIVQGFRTALSDPDLPTVIVGIGDITVASGDPLYAWQTVQQLQRAVELPHIAHVSAAGLPLRADGFHIAGSAHIALGTMVAKAFGSIR
jgi:hypothetical protein